MKQRELASTQTPPVQQGFLGPGHTARAVVYGNHAQTDPFIILMDDDVTVPDGEPVGGPHPHAGFETVTLMLEGAIGNHADGMKAGDMEMMTAGSGIVHTESLPPGTRVRLMQLWLNLPTQDRWATPRVQKLLAEHVPTLAENGATIKVYSGELAGLKSPLLNHTPVIIADVQLDAGVSQTLSIPASYNAFAYAIEGNASVGEANKPLTQGQVGWLERASGDGFTALTVRAGASGVRFLFYAGGPQRADIVSYGPFIADSKTDIARLYHDYHQGKMKHVSTLPEAQVFEW